MLVFVTVGSTKFDLLVESVLSDETLAGLRRKGYDKVVLQRGNSEVDGLDSSDSLTLQKHGLDLDIWRFKPSLQDEYERADLVISHAGSGTILDVLRLRKPLIVVPNATLLDNHQQELASKLQSLGYLKATSVHNLRQAIAEFEPSSLTPFPSFDGAKFSGLLDEQMGFS